MLNVANRTLFTGDNLDVMRGINSECIDLIYLDPPFNSNQDFAAPIGSEAAGAAFKDSSGRRSGMARTDCRSASGALCDH